MARLSAEARRLIKGKNFAFIGTVNRDGTPQVTVVWIDLRGDTVLVNTAVGRVKHRNVVRDPRVTVALYEQSNPYHEVVIRGKVVRQVRGKRAEDHINELSYKYTGDRNYKKSDPSEKRVIFEIEPSRVTLR